MMMPILRIKSVIEIADRQPPRILKGSFLLLWIAKGFLSIASAKCSWPRPADAEGDVLDSRGGAPSYSGAGVIDFGVPLYESGIYLCVVVVTKGRVQR